MNKHHEALNRMVIEDNATAALEDGAGNVLAEFGKPSVSMAADTMTGDLMACLIDEFKSAPDVWQKMPEHQQQDLIYRVQQRVQENIRQAVEIIASDNRPTIVATVESVTVKDGIKAVVTLPKSDAQRHELFDAAGMAVLLIVGGAAGYYGGTDQVRPDPDQPALNGFGDEERDAA
jgi:acyl-CoA reductase-like NAD-dependent aldehyde dehydrogenase